MAKKISDTLVIIPTYGKHETVLLACIKSLVDQIPENKIVIVDTAPGFTSSVVKTKYNSINVIILKDNLGPAGGRNAGLARLTTESFILFFDHDMVAEKGMVDYLRRPLIENPSIGITTPKIYYSQDKGRIWSAGTGINLWTGQVIFRGGLDNGQFNEDLEVQVAPAALMVKREVINKLKGFNSDYFATFEDTDFCFSAKKIGFITWYAHQAIAYHDISPSPDLETDRLLSRAYYVARNRIIFLKKFGHRPPLFIIFTPLFAIHYIKLAVTKRRFSAIVGYLRGLYDGYIY